MSKKGRADGDLTIDELMLLPAEVLRGRCELMTEQFPSLKYLYDDAFLTKLSSRRTTENYLLFVLAQPNDAAAVGQMLELSRLLDFLKAEGSFEKFRTKFRHLSYSIYASALSELHFAAWMKERHYHVVLEPPVGTKLVEFSASRGDLTLWFEVKSLQDLPDVKDADSVTADVMQRLRRIEQPYALHIREATLESANVAALVRKMKKLFAAHFLAGGALPFTFEIDGLSIEANATESENGGYLASSMGREYVFGDEHSDQARRRIREAIRQLPQGESGIVVIDRTNSTFMHDEDVMDACFGTESLRVMNGNFVNWRDADGAFRPDSNTRISAVISYTRRFVGGPEYLILHNPFAARQLTPEALGGPDVTQRRYNPAARSFVDF
jgi:hypothetical protein